jgi:hypothetical protein
MVPILRTENPDRCLVARIYGCMLAIAIAVTGVPAARYRRLQPGLTDKDQGPAVSE